MQSEIFDILQVGADPLESGMVCAGIYMYIYIYIYINIYIYNRSDEAHNLMTTAPGRDRLLPPDCRLPAAAEGLGLRDFNPERSLKLLFSKVYSP